MNFLTHAIRGCRDLPGYGPHPGTLTLGIYVIAAALAGVRNGGWNGFFGSAAIGLACLGPFYLYGAYSRSKDYEQDMINLMKKIKDA
jgi:hypothetical protein